MPADLNWLYQRLFDHFGPQHWWPAETPFEVMVGAILTQNTAWTNVEKAIADLREADSLSLDAIIGAEPTQLAEWLRPSGYFNIKAKRLQNFCRWYVARGGFDELQKLDTKTLRHALLSVNGVGAETADDMLLYALNRPVFVVDAYTRRLFTRLGLIEGGEGYEHLRHLVEKHLGHGKRATKLFNELHALIVAHAKAFCLKRPRCKGCPLSRRCPGRE